jgi:hypothetical protein
MYAFTASPIFQMAQSDQKSLLTLTVVKIDIKKSCYYFLVGGRDMVEFFKVNKHF